MATAANMPPGAVPTNGSIDPFTNSPSHSHPAPLRYSAFDSEDFTAYATNSPSSARHALEAHLRDTDRRIQDASRLGTTLVQQRKDLAARLKEVESLQSENEIPADLREKLVELEREYNEVGRESARAFLPKSRVVSSEGSSDSATMTSVLSAQARESPAKMSAPLRRQRNQPTNRIHDIEFATEISTSLLAQVRQLQAALAEKDDALRDATATKATLETETMGLVQRIRHMDENEQRYKDESWNLEMRLQDLEANLKDTTDKHARVTQSLTSVESEKAAKERELDDMKLAHDRAIETHIMSKKVQEADLHGLRRDAANHESERQKLQKKVDELTSQNTELAKAVSYRWNVAGQASETDFISAEEGPHSDDGLGDFSDPPSPIKGTPARHGMLESETLKSSLNHAHRMIQNLKNNIHREKTEKMELKRMLQDARDELETRRDSGAQAANIARKRKEAEGPKFRKPAKSDRLGATRSSTTEVIPDDHDWESEEGERTPSKSAAFPAALGAVVAAGGATAYDHAYNAGDDTSTDAFETADERNTTESEAFATGAEDFGDDTEGDLTETEGGVGRNKTPRNISGISNKRGDRRSFLSSASTSGDDDEDQMLRTPVQYAQQPKYRVRLNRGSKRAGRVNDLMSDSPSNNSASSSQGTPQAARNMQSLEDELGALDDESVDGTPRSVHNLDEEMLEDAPGSQGMTHTDPVTPSKRSTIIHESPAPVVASTQDEDHAEPQISSPVLSEKSPKVEDEKAGLAHQSNVAMLAHEHATHKAVMVDAGIMTDPWQPETVQGSEKSNLRERAEDIVGGALAGLGLGTILKRDKSKKENDTSEAKLDQDMITEEQDEARDVQVDGEAIHHPPTANKEVTAAMTEPRDLHDHSAAPVEAPIASIEDAVQTPISNHEAGQKDSAAMAALPIDEPQGSGLKQLKPSTELPSIAKSPTVSPSNADAVQLPKQVALMAFSSIMAQDFEPSPVEEEAFAPLLPRKSSKRRDISPMAAEPKVIAGTLNPVHESHGTDGGQYVSPRSLQNGMVIDPQAPSHAHSAATEPKVLADGSVDTPALPHGHEPDRGSTYEGTTAVAAREPLGEIPPNVTVRKNAADRDSMLPVTKPLQIKKPMVHEGSQTMLSSEEIDDMIRDKAAVEPLAPATAVQDAGNSPMTPPKAATAGAAAAIAAAAAAAAAPAISSVPAAQVPRRPTSASSMRSLKSGVPQPPLPVDHTQKIAAATQQAPASGSTAGSMGPPLMPASAYKSARPRTPGERAGERGSSRDGTTPRPGRARDSRGHAPPLMASPSGRISHRTSMSSFASELDDRFDISRGNIMYPHDVEPATDPRMIQAITQTMIGEFLWKYTRKAGRSETSKTRHRRFFWVHPYTRTLYWSEQDPSTAGKSMLKAKSVAIEAVRVITDDNVFPPGLHRKSLIVITPGREIVFTAPSSQRHETWFNALSYLLLKTEAEKEEADDVVNEEDMDEFRPGFGRSVRKSFSKMTSARSLSRHSQRRRSLSSYHSQTTRTSSPQRTEAISNLVNRQSTGAASQQQKGNSATTALPSLSLQPASAAQKSATTSSRRDQRESSGTVTGRISSLASRLRPSSRGRQSTEHSKVRGATDPAQIYDASIIGDSAEDLRAQLEQQERNAAMLENVRACCDGKHDVGSLSRTGRSSFGNRFGGAAGHSHSHPATDSMRSRT